MITEKNGGFKNSDSCWLKFATSGWVFENMDHPRWKIGGSSKWTIKKKIVGFSNPKISLKEDDLYYTQNREHFREYILSAGVYLLLSAGRNVQKGSSLEFENEK